MMAYDSMANANKRGESGQPCLVPREGEWLGEDTIDSDLCDGGLVEEFNPSNELWLCDFHIAPVQPFAISPLLRLLLV